MSKKRKSGFAKEPDFPKLMEYVGEVGRQMGLVGWTIGLANVPCDEPYVATIEQSTAQKHACICLCRDWAKRSPEEQRETVVHELTHVYLFDVQTSVALAGAVMQCDAHAVLVGHHNYAIEYAVDAIAKTIAPHMPLPPE